MSEISATLLNKSLLIITIVIIIQFELKVIPRSKLDVTYETKMRLYSLSIVAVPVLVTEMKFGHHKLKILNFEKWCFSSPPL